MFTIIICIRIVEIIANERRKS